MEAQTYLIHVDGLDQFAAGKDQRMQLILTFRIRGWCVWIVRVTTDRQL